MSGSSKTTWEKAIWPAIALAITTATGILGTMWNNERVQAGIYTELISQRETAESTLRKDMLSKLVDKFFAEASVGSAVPDSALVENIETMVLYLELITYNFHESLHLSPLFYEVNRMISRLTYQGQNRIRLQARLDKLALKAVYKQVESIRQYGATRTLDIDMVEAIRTLTRPEVTEQLGMVYDQAAWEQADELELLRELGHEIFGAVPLESIGDTAHESTPWLIAPAFAHIDLLPQDPRDLWVQSLWDQPPIAFEYIFRKSSYWAENGLMTLPVLELLVENAYGGSTPSWFGTYSDGIDRSLCFVQFSGIESSDLIDLPNALVWKDSLILSRNDQESSLHTSVAVTEIDVYNKELGISLVTHFTNQPGDTVAFHVGIFDFPLIDNTRLPDDRRLAVFIEKWDSDHFQIRLGLAVFPAYIATMREKPYISEVVERMGS